MSLLSMIYIEFNDKKVYIKLLNPRNGYHLMFMELRDYYYFGGYHPEYILKTFRLERVVPASKIKTKFKLIY